ncbi:MAG: alkaline phosphatase family protein [Proteobacteria bacterium]|nr:alkaline phosphatase family protein [Pseudomonadota bacterium]
MIPRLLLVTALTLAVAPAHAAPPSARNVVLVVCDGLRWQEVFQGADPVLLADRSRPGSWTPAAMLEARFGGASAEVRRARLMPFLWGTVARDGQVLGNPARGSRVSVANHAWVSYPGYSEMLTGNADPAIDRNEFGPNPHATVFEWLNADPAFRGQVAVFGTWSVLRDVFGAGRSRLPLRVGPTAVDHDDRSPEGRAFADLDRTTTSLYGSNVADGFLHLAVRRALERSRPRVLFVGYGDADLWAHMGRYDLVLETLQHFDAFVADLWRTLQSRPEYRGTTTLLLTADHGRGSGALDWREHGAGVPGSGEIWLAALGAGVPALGERRDTPPIVQGQVAASIAALLGRHYTGEHGEAAAPFLDVLAGPPAH